MKSIVAEFVFQNVKLFKLSHYPIVTFYMIKDKYSDIKVFRRHQDKI